MLIADGKFHRYNLDLGNVDPDDAEIYATHLLPTDAPGAEVKIRSMRFSDLPEGEPSIRFHWAGMGEAFNRIGQGPREFVVSLENQGGEGSRDLEIAELTLPPASGSPRGMSRGGSCRPSERTTAATAGFRWKPTLRSEGSLPSA